MPKSGMLLTCQISHLTSSNRSGVSLAKDQTDGMKKSKRGEDGCSAGLVEPRCLLKDLHIFSLSKLIW